MNLKSRVDKLELEATSSNQTNPELDAKIAALEAELRSMSDEELRVVITDGYGNVNDEFSTMTDRQLWELIIREES